MSAVGSSKLNAQRLREVLAYDPETGLFTWRVSRGSVAAGKVAGSPTSDGYIGIKVDRTLHLAHRLAWLWVHGEWPSKQIDHRNGIRDDNRIANLREASPAVNSQNRRTAQKGSRTNLLGASSHRRGFQAQIVFKGKKRYLGIYDTAEEAHAAYIAAKRNLHEGCTL